MANKVGKGIRGFADDPLAPAFTKWVENLPSKDREDLNEKLLWRAFTMGAEAYKALPIDTLEMCKKLREQDQIAIIWSIEDVQDICRETDNVELTDEQAREVLFEAEKRHDANYGISLDTLRTYASLNGFLDSAEDDDELEDDDIEEHEEEDSSEILFREKLMKGGASVFCVLVCLLCGFYPIVAADKPSQPTSVVFTYSPAFGGPLTVRAAWSEPKRWNDTGSSGDRYYIVHCEIGNTGQLVYNQTVSAQQFLVQFDVPNPRTNYLVRVYAVNRNGLLGQPGKASLRIP